jgi:hypothetical protein
LNNLNEALNNDMRNIIEQAKQISGASLANKPIQDKESNVSGRHVLLSAYQSNNDEKEH